MTPLARALRKAFAQREAGELPIGDSAVIHGWVNEPRPPATRFAAFSRDVVWPEPAIPQSPLVWPEICERIAGSAAGPALAGIADQLLAWRQATGGQRILVTGPGRQTGRTATLLALARKLLDHPAVSILLVDACGTANCWETSTGDQDGNPPDLTDTEGFEHSRSSRSTVIQTLIPGRLWGASLAHLRESALEPADVSSPVSEPGSGLLLVLVDGGAWETLDRSTWLRAGVVDGMIEIRRYGDPQVDTELDQRREAAGIPVLGVIETLAPLVTR